MLANTEFKMNKVRDGHHCDLCGCSFPAVKCDKCSSQIFCLSCDDMYHRHPKRRFHLRKAVDPTPTPQARPVLPMKVSNLTLAPGDPAKMPLPPPRKKKPGKSFFDNFRRGSPASDTSPTLPKKEYSWSGKLSNITKFMSNRPLPPVPDAITNVNNETAPPDHHLSFIHRKVDEKPPALPQRQPRGQPYSPPSSTSPIEQNGEKHDLKPMMNGNTPSYHFDHKMGMNQNWMENPTLRNEMISQPFGTIRRQSQPLDKSSNAAGDKSINMHHSSSASDLTAISDVSSGAGMPPYPHYPYPPPPHITPPYPYPVYPQYPPYPQYFGNSWANLAAPLPTTDPDFSDQSESSSRRFNRAKYKSHFEKKAKRSQSVMVDRMAYPPGHFYPFGPYPPGYPWMSGPSPEAPPSPAVSLRSLSRLSQQRRMRKTTDEDEDDYDDLSSSPLSRPKSSSSELSKNRLAEKPKSYPSPSSSSSEHEGRSKIRAKQFASPAIERKHLKHREFQKSAENLVQSRNSSVRSPVTSGDGSGSKTISQGQTQYLGKSPGDTSPSRRYPQSTQVVETNAQQSSVSKENKIKDQPGTWQCNHCTYINPLEVRICQVCCKTANHVDQADVPNEEVELPQQNSVNNSNESGIKQTSALNKQLNDDDQDSADKQDIISLSTALDEAEKQINESLEELLRVKEEFTKPPEEKPSQKPKKSFLKKFTSSKKKSEASATSEKSDTTNINTKLQPERTITPLPNVKDVGTSINGTQTDNSVEKKESASTFTNAPATSDSFCQTYQDVTAPEMMSPMSPVLGGTFGGLIRPPENLMPPPVGPSPMRYNSYQDTVDPGLVGGYGGLYRAHSRASLFGGRVSDAGPTALEYGNPNGGAGQSLYRSLSRASLLGEMDNWNFGYNQRTKPDFYLSMEELVERRRQETMRAQGLELVRMIREAEQLGFTADDIQVALNNCGKQNPVNWLQENWKNIIKTVVTLATNYGKDKKENDVGVISESEAREAVRFHKGNIWAAVTECVEGRQRKFLELGARGKFAAKDILDALTASEGDVEIAYVKLSNTNLKPFLMRIWGSGEGVPNLEGALLGPIEKNQILHQEYDERNLKKIRK